MGLVQLFYPINYGIRLRSNLVLPLSLIYPLILFIAIACIVAMIGTVETQTEMMKQNAFNELFGKLTDWQFYPKSILVVYAILGIKIIHFWYKNNKGEAFYQLDENYIAFRSEFNLFKELVSSFLYAHNKVSNNQTAGDPAGKTENFIKASNLTDSLAESNAKLIEIVAKIIKKAQDNTLLPRMLKADLKVLSEIKIGLTSIYSYLNQERPNELVVSKTQSRRSWWEYQTRFYKLFSMAGVKTGTIDLRIACEAYHWLNKYVDYDSK